jgi:hypothetical protein
MRTTAQLADGLYVVEMFKRMIKVCQIEGLGKRQWRNGLADIIELPTPHTPRRCVRPARGGALSTP